MKRLLYLLVLISGCGFAQEMISEEYELYNDSIYLPGTLSYPETENQLPLVIFIHGSGNADRNGNQGALANANHIKQLADSLNQRGFAFYRFDKRNSIPSNLKKIVIEESSIRDLVDDVRIAINKFSNDERFSSIYLIGHSQGSLVGMMATSKNIKGYISLAGPGTTIDKSLIRQLTQQNEEMGKVTTAHITELMETDTIKEVNIMLFALFAPQNQKYLKDWIMISPTTEIKKLNIPVLIINGSSDIQVTVEDAELLKKAKPEAKLVIINKMNHMLKIVENEEENQQSYYNPDFSLSSDLVKEISEFIKTNG